MPHPSNSHSTMHSNKHMCSSAPLPPHTHIAVCLRKGYGECANCGICVGGCGMGAGVLWVFMCTYMWLYNVCPYYTISQWQLQHVNIPTPEQTHTYPPTCLKTPQTTHLITTQCKLYIHTHLHTLQKPCALTQIQLCKHTHHLSKAEHTQTHSSTHWLAEPCHAQCHIPWTL
jgi:hypothetical protein